MAFFFPAQVDRCLSSRTTWSTEQVSGHPELHRKTLLFWKTKAKVIIIFLLEMQLNNHKAHSLKRWNDTRVQDPCLTRGHAYCWNSGQATYPQSPPFFPYMPTLFPVLLPSLLCPCLRLRQRPLLDQSPCWSPEFQVGWLPMKLLTLFVTPPSPIPLLLLVTVSQPPPLVETPAQPQATPARRPERKQRPWNKTCTQ